jgi:hypothetical protein
VIETEFLPQTGKGTFGVLRGLDFLLTTGGILYLKWQDGVGFGNGMDAVNVEFDVFDGTRFDVRVDQGPFEINDTFGRERFQVTYHFLRGFRIVDIFEVTCLYGIE